jgi:hypothetical protein
MLDKSSLHGMQLARLANAFYGHDIVALMHRRQGQATVHATAIDVNRTGAALTVIATLLRAGQVKALAQTIEQSYSGLNLEFALLAVHAQDHRNHS